MDAHNKKFMKLLLKNWGFWSIIANVILLATVIIMSVIWSGHSCPVLNVAPYENKAIELQFKVKEYENKLFIQNAIIDGYNNDKLDSVWSAIQR